MGDWFILFSFVLGRLYCGQWRPLHPLLGQVEIRGRFSEAEKNYAPFKPAATKTAMTATGTPNAQQAIKEELLMTSYRVVADSLDR